MEQALSTLLCELGKLASQPQFENRHPQFGWGILESGEEVTANDVMIVTPGVAMLSAAEWIAIVQQRAGSQDEEISKVQAYCAAFLEAWFQRYDFCIYRKLFP